jgi:hypothetical protein
MSYLIGQGSDIGGSFNLTQLSFEMLESGVYDVKYNEIYWNKMLEKASVKTDAPVGSRQYSSMLKDQTGMGAFVNGAGSNIPTVDVGVGKITVPIEMAAVSAVVTEDEARMVQFGHSMSLMTEKGNAMRLASERHIERTFFFGNDNLGFNAFINYPGVDVMTAGAKAGGAGWADATADEMFKDMNDAMTRIANDTRSIALAGHIILPTSAYFRLGTVRIDATSESALDYFVKNNVYTLSTGQPLEITGLPYLEDAATDGSGRMIVKVKSVQNDCLPMPQTLTLKAPQEQGLLTKVFGTYEVGSYLNRFPKEMIYMDGL